MAAKLGLRNDYLDNLLFQASNYFVGVNNLSDILHEQGIFSTIVNSSGHFVTLIGRPETLYYIDSFGLSPIDEEIEQFISSDKRPCIINSTTYQHPLSIHCGFFAAFFVLYSEIGRVIDMEPFDPTLTERNDNICVNNLVSLLHATKYTS